METKVKKLEEQISFLQNEVNQMSDEIFIQQKEIIKLNNEGETPSLGIYSSLLKPIELAN